MDNDPKGTGPFLLAGIEVQKLLSTPARAAAARHAAGIDYERRARANQGAGVSRA